MQEQLEFEFMEQPKDPRDIPPSELVREFHNAYSQAVDKNRKIGSDLDKMRWKLLFEEFDEVVDAEGDNEALLKELCDLLYVVYGFAVTYGWDIEGAFRRVHESNMSKLGVDGKPIYRDDGKVLKGPHYFEPDMKEFL